MTDLINQSFVTVAGSLESPIRVDGRGPGEFRDTSIHLGPSNGQSQIRIGSTLVSASVTGEITPPMPERPNEGRIFFNVELGQIAQPSVYEYGRPTPEATSLCNYVERVIKGSKAIDTESLCILGGRSVWSIRCDIHVLNDDGNLGDTCALAAMCAFLNFRHRSVTVDGEEATVFHENTRDPVPLSIHHIPISATFVVFPSRDGVTWFADPTRQEEAAFKSRLSLTVNQHGELCGVNQPGGIPIEEDILVNCSRAAIERAKRISDLVKAEVVKHLAAR